MLKKYIELRGFVILLINLFSLAFARKSQIFVLEIWYVFKCFDYVDIFLFLSASKFFVNYFLDKSFEIWIMVIQIYF